MAYKIKRKPKKDSGDEAIEYWFYGAIPDVVQKTNPANMSARSLGHEPKEETDKKKKKKKKSDSI